FAATEEVRTLIALSAYIPTDEERLGALACVEKAQFCRDEGHGECSPWIGMVPGVNGEIGVEQFYNSSSPMDKGLISLVTGRIGGTIGNAARGARSELLVLRSLTSIPSFDGRLLPFQTTTESDLWKDEVI